MERLIEFPLEDGGLLMVEVYKPAPGRGVVRAGHIVAAAEKAGQTFETALEKIKPAAAAIINHLRNLSETPEDILVEFGLKFSEEAGRLYRLGRQRG